MAKIVFTPLVKDIHFPLTTCPEPFRLPIVYTPTKGDR